MAPTVKVMLEHVLVNIFGMEQDDIKLLEDKRIRNYSNLTDMKFETLDGYLKSDLVFDGTYQDIKLWNIYVEVSQPTHDKVMINTKEQWMNLDKKDIVQKYNAFTTPVSTPALSTFTTLNTTTTQVPQAATSSSYP